MSFKKVLLLSSLTIAITLIYSLFINKDKGEPQIVINEKWHTFEKDKTVLKMRESTQKELKLIKAKKKPLTKRKPASLNKRNFIGSKKPKSNRFVNKINPRWKKLLGSELLNHRIHDSKVYIKGITGLIKREKTGLRYVEKVVITSFDQKGREYSFNALVDSSNGKVLETWNRTIHEGFGQRHQGFSAVPLE